MPRQGGGRSLVRMTRKQSCEEDKETGRRIIKRSDGQDSDF